MHAHCYLHRPNLVPFGHRLPYAPHYFLKLKSAEALIQVRHPLLLYCWLLLLWHSYLTPLHPQCVQAKAIVLLLLYRCTVGALLTFGLEHS